MLEELRSLWPVLRPVLKRRRVWAALLALVASLAALAGYQIDLGPLADILTELFTALLGN